MTFAVLGGTFDPVHIGHLVLAQQVREEFGYERVLLVPANVPPHKVATPGRCATPSQRREMLQLSVAGLEGLAVEDCELNRGGVSYTVETLDQLSASLKPKGLPGLILGDDLVSGFDTWRDPERLARISDIIVAHRDRSDEVPFAYRHRYAHNMLLGISSTHLRSRIGSALPVGFLVPPAVLDYIRSAGLYGATPGSR